MIRFAFFMGAKGRELADRISLHPLYVWGTWHDNKNEKYMEFMDKIAEEIRLIEERNEAQERLADYLKVLAKKKEFGRLEQRTLRHLQFRVTQANEAIESFGRVAL